MRTTPARLGQLALRWASAWAIFTVVFAILDYLLDDRDRPFEEVLPGAAVHGVLFLIFFGLWNWFLNRRKTRATTGANDQTSAESGTS